MVARKGGTRRIDLMDATAQNRRDVRIKPRSVTQRFAWREPAKVRPAATLMLLRDNEGRIEVLMTRRSLTASFAPGAYVFPGGVMDPEDTACLGSNIAPNSKHGTSEIAGLAVAAIREAFEELGVLLANPGDCPSDQLDRDQPLLSQLRQHSGQLLLDQLASFSHWQTDRDLPRRFDVRFFVAPMPENQVAIADEQEQFEPEWIVPSEGLARYERGEFNIIFPTIRTLRVLTQFKSVADVMKFAREQTEATLPVYCPRAGLRAGMDSRHTEDEMEFGELELVTPDGQIQHHLDWQNHTPVQLLHHVWRLTSPNPSMMTGPGTNTYIVGGDGGYAVIDPGPVIESHLERIQAFVGNQLKYILCTHSHPDHHPGAEVLSQRTGAKVLGMTMSGKEYPTAWQFLPDFDFGIETEKSIEWTVRVKNAESEITLPITLRAIHTPGHAKNHLCFLLEEDGLLFSGDHILNGVTPVISPPHGHMNDYFRSLDQLAQLPLSFILPAHGYVLGDPYGAIKRLKAHRLKREVKVLAAFERLHSGEPERLVSLVYDDVDSRLHKLAQDSLLAHLIKLAEDGKIDPKLLPLASQIQVRSTTI